MTAILAERVHANTARKHFENGGRVLVTETDEANFVVVTPGTTWHSRETTTWEELSSQVRMWRSRYPRQRYYIIPDTAPVGPPVSR